MIHVLFARFHLLICHHHDVILSSDCKNINGTNGQRIVFLESVRLSAIMVSLDPSRFRLVIFYPLDGENYDEEFIIRDRDSD